MATTILTTLRWGLPVVIGVCVVFLWWYASQSVRRPAAEQSYRWYAALTLVVLILSLVGWLIVLIPGPAEQLHLSVVGSSYLC